MSPQDVQLIATIVSVVIALSSVTMALIFNILNTKHNNISDEKTRQDAEVKRASDMATLNAALQVIQVNTNEIRTEQRATRDCMADLTRRVIIIEQSTKSAHKRLDNVETRLNMETQLGGCDED